jgi:hypothetical protein
LIDHDSSNDDSAVKLTEDEEDDWQSLQAHGVWFEGYTTCDSALEVCEIHSVDRVLDLHLIRPDEEPEEQEKVAEQKAILLDPLKRLEHPQNTFVNLIPRAILL